MIDAFVFSVTEDYWVLARGGSIITEGGEANEKSKRDKESWSAAVRRVNPLFLSLLSTSQGAR